MKIRPRVVASLQEDVDAVQRRIAERAASLFLERGSTPGNAIDDWVRAEQETIWKPAMVVVRTEDAFIVEAAVAGVNPKRLDLQVTDAELLLRSDVKLTSRDIEGEVVLSEFIDGPLFRTYRFPAPIDPARVSAECVNGMLKITAPIAEASPRLVFRAA